MKSTASKSLLIVGLVVLGVALAAAGIFIGEADDAPGASLAGILFMLGAFVLAVRKARSRS
jgi:uncharacterized membrane protein YdcZ (DUF606 family)